MIFVPECFANILVVINRGCWQSIVVVVVAQRHRANGLLNRLTYVKVWLTEVFALIPWL